MKNKLIEDYYRNNYKSLVKMARKRVGDYSIFLAEEAVQEAFMRAIKYFKSYKKEEDFDRWFKRILNNCSNQIKKRERDRGVTHNSDVDVENIEFEPKLEIPIQFYEELNTMSKVHASVLSMYFFYGFKSREIAEFHSLGHDNVRQIILRFRRRFDANH